MQQKEWFENWFGSPYYEALYQNRSYEEARVFIDNLLHFLDPAPASRMLDIACGEGRHSIQLAAHGFDVTGIDLSTDNIAKAGRHEQENLQFYVQDMRFPFYINYFDYAFNFFTSFGYFATQRDHHMAAKAFAAGLRKGGILVIDYLNVHHSLQHLVPDETVEREDYTFRIRRVFEDKHFKKFIDVTDAHGREHHFMESVAGFGLDNFLQIFNNIAGLQLVHSFGDYQLQPFEAAKSPRLIMIFKKPL